LPLPPLGALTLGVDEANEIQWLFAANAFLNDANVFGTVNYRPRFGVAPWRYSFTFTRLFSSNQATLGYDRRFLLGKTQADFTVLGGLYFTPYRYATPFGALSLTFRQERSLGRNRLWGEASEGVALTMEAAYNPHLSGRIRFSALQASGLFGGAELGHNRMDPFYLPGLSGSAWLGFKTPLIVDHYRKDGLYYTSHFTLEPEALLLYDEVRGWGWGTTVTLKGHFVYRYYVPITASLTVGYRSDWGWIFKFGN